MWRRVGGRGEGELSGVIEERSIKRKGEGKKGNISRSQYRRDKCSHSLSQSLAVTNM